MQQRDIITSGTKANNERPIIYVTPKEAAPVQGRLHQQSYG
jgi:hypothetical protein